MFQVLPMASPIRTMYKMIYIYLKRLTAGEAYILANNILSQGQTDKTTEVWAGQRRKYKMFCYMACSSNRMVSDNMPLSASWDVQMMMRKGHKKLLFVSKVNDKFN